MKGAGHANQLPFPLESVDFINKNRKNDLFYISIQILDLVFPVLEGLPDPDKDILKQIVPIGGMRRIAEEVEFGPQMGRKRLQDTFD